MRSFVPRVDPRLTRRLTAAALVLALAACASEQSTSPPPAARSRIAALRTAQHDGRRIIGVNSPNAAAVVAAVEAEGGTVTRRHDDAGLLNVSGLSDEAAARIRTRTDVAAVAIDADVQWLPTPDPAAQRVQYFPIGAPGTQADQSGAYFYVIGYQWDMVAIRTIDAQRSTPAGQGRLVCVLDTGVDPGQQELVGKVDLTVSTSFIASEPFIEDLHFHGTHVSSTIAGNGIAMVSVAPNATLCAVKVLSQFGSGPFSGVTDGIIYAATSRKNGGAGADVINMSLGAYLDLSDPDAADVVTVQQMAIDFAWKRGVVVVVSAGNDANDLAHDPPNMLEVPAELKHVVTVGATGPTDGANPDGFASYSNFGRNDIAAPGGGVDGITPLWYHDFVLAACSRYVCGGDGWYVWAAGTSMAAPHVSGAAAVVMSLHRGEREGEDVVEALYDGADKLRPRSLYGAGRLNVFKSAQKGHHGGGGDSKQAE